MKKIVIIGGGIAGLSAGIYAQKAGYQSEIYEKNTVAGGQCTGWDRKGCHIDNCIHWLTGTKNRTALYQLWQDVGVLNENIRLIQTDRFYTSELDGKSASLWKDLDKTEKELLQISPEDSEEIHKLIKYTKLAESCSMPVEKPMDMLKPWDYIIIGMKMAGMPKVMKEYGKISIEDLADRFKSPLIRTLLMDYFPKEYLAYCLVVSYAAFTSGNGAIPEDGSTGMVKRMIKRYEELGGLLNTGITADKVIINGNKAKGIKLTDGTTAEADYVICAADTSETFNKLLGSTYMDEELKKRYEDRRNYPVFSSFQMAFSVDINACNFDDIMFLSCEPARIGKNVFRRIMLKSFAYEPSYAPEGRTVLQASIPQNEDDFFYWKNISINKEEYQREKLSQAQKVMDLILLKFPTMQGNIELLDCWTPVTYERYCNSYHGAYMSFIITKSGKSKAFTGKLQGLQNVFLASQWQQSPGGLPTAAAMGKFAVQRILKLEKKSYKL